MVNYVEVNNKDYFKIKLITISLFLLLLYPNMIGVSRYIYLGSSFVIAGTLFLAVFLMFKSNRKYMIKYGLSLFFIEIFWVLTLLLMIISSQDFKHGDTGIVIQYGLLVIFIVTSKYSSGWLKDYKKYMLAFALVHSIFSIIFFVIPGIYPKYIIKLFDSQYHTQLLHWYNSGYATGFATHYSQNGIFLAISTGVIFCIIICNKDKRIRNITSFLISIIALILTGKRGPLLFCILSILILYYMYKSNKPVERLIKIIGIIAIGISGVIILSKYVPAIENTLNRFTSYGSDITNGRTELYEFAWQWFNENPTFGIGWGGYPYRVNKTFIGAIYGRNSNMYAHNVYLQLLCEVGIVGFLLFMVPMFYTVIKTKKLLKMNRFNKIILDKDEECALSISLFVQIFFLLYCFTGNPLYDYSSLFPYMISCAVTGAVAFKKNNYII